MVFEEVPFDVIPRILGMDAFLFALVSLILGVFFYLIFIDRPDKKDRVNAGIKTTLLVGPIMGSIVLYQTNFIENVIFYLSPLRFHWIALVLLLSILYYGPFFLVRRKDPDKQPYCNEESASILAISAIFTISIIVLFTIIGIIGYTTPLAPNFIFAQLISEFAFSIVGILLFLFMLEVIGGHWEKFYYIKRIGSKMFKKLKSIRIAVLLILILGLIGFITLVSSIWYPTTIGAPEQITEITAKIRSSTLGEGISEQIFEVFYSKEFDLSSNLLGKAYLPYNGLTGETYKLKYNCTDGNVTRTTEKACGEKVACGTSEPDVLLENRTDGCFLISQRSFYTHRLVDTYEERYTNFTGINFNQTRICNGNNLTVILRYTDKTNISSTYVKWSLIDTEGCEVLNCTHASRWGTQSCTPVRSTGNLIYISESIHQSPAMFANETPAGKIILELNCSNEFFRSDYFQPCKAR